MHLSTEQIGNIRKAYGLPAKPMKVPKGHVAKMRKLSLQKRIMTSLENMPRSERRRLIGIKD